MAGQCTITVNVVPAAAPARGIGAGTLLGLTLFAGVLGAVIISRK